MILIKITNLSVQYRVYLIKEVRSLFNVGIVEAKNMVENGTAIVAVGGVGRENFIHVLQGLQVCWKQATGGSVPELSFSFDFNWKPPERQDPHQLQSNHIPYSSSL